MAGCAAARPSASRTAATSPVSRAGLNADLSALDCSEASTHCRLMTTDNKKNWDGLDADTVMSGWITAEEVTQALDEIAAEAALRLN